MAERRDHETMRAGLAQLWKFTARGFGPPTRHLCLGRDALSGREFRNPPHRGLASPAPFARGQCPSWPHTVPAALSAASSSSDLKSQPVLSRLALQASSSSAADMAPRKGRVAVAQMTATSDIDANFETCRKLVKVSLIEAGLVQECRVILCCSSFCLCFIQQLSRPSLPLLPACPSSTQQAAAEGVQLLSLPECFSFIGAKEGEAGAIAEPLDGPIMQRYCQLARWEMGHSFCACSVAARMWMLSEVPIREGKSAVSLSTEGSGDRLAQGVQYCSNAALLSCCRDSGMWLSLGGFQEVGDPSAEGRYFNTHVLLDDTGSIVASYRKIHLYESCAVRPGLPSKPPLIFLLACALGAVASLEAQSSHSSC